MQQVVPKVILLNDHLVDLMRFDNICRHVQRWPLLKVKDHIGSSYSYDDHPYEGRLIEHNVNGRNIDTTRYAYSNALLKPLFDQYPDQIAVIYKSPINATVYFYNNADVVDILNFFVTNIAVGDAVEPWSRTNTTISTIMRVAGSYGRTDYININIRLHVYDRKDQIIGNAYNFPHIMYDGHEFLSTPVQLMCMILNIVLVDVAKLDDDFEDNMIGSRRHSERKLVMLEMTPNLFRLNKKNPTFDMYNIRLGNMIYNDNRTSCRRINSRKNEDYYDDDYSNRGNYRYSAEQFIDTIELLNGTNDKNIKLNATTYKGLFENCTYVSEQDIMYAFSSYHDYINVHFINFIHAIYPDNANDIMLKVIEEMMTKGNYVKNEYSAMNRAYKKQEAARVLAEAALPVPVVEGEGEDAGEGESVSEGNEGNEGNEVKDDDTPPINDDSNGNPYIDDDVITSSDDEEDEVIDAVSGFIVHPMFQEKYQLALKINRDIAAANNTPLVITTGPHVRNRKITASEWYGITYHDIGLNKIPDVFTAIDSSSLSDFLKEKLTKILYHMWKEDIMTDYFQY